MSLTRVKSCQLVSPYIYPSLFLLSFSSPFPFSSIAWPHAMHSQKSHRHYSMLVRPRPSRVVLLLRAHTLRRAVRPYVTRILFCNAGHSTL